MKFKSLLFASLCIAVAAVACKQPEQPQEEKTVSVSTQEVNISTAGGEQTVNIKSNAAWTAVSSVDWIAVNPAQGNGDASVRVSVTPNEGPAGNAAQARSGIVTVKVEGKEVTFKVSQKAEEIVFAVTGDTAQFSADGGTLKVKVEYNTGSYTTGTLPAWITATKTVATDNLTFAVAKNETYEERTAEITFTGGDKTGKVSVKQAAANKPDEPLPTVVTIAKAFEGTAAATVEGLVVATCAKGYVLKDDSMAALVYTNAATTFEIGDKVKITATPAVYNYGAEFTNPTAQEKLAHADYAQPVPKVLDAATLTAAIASVNGKDKNKDLLVTTEYASLTGTLYQNGTYYNIKIDDTTAEGSLYQPLSVFSDKYASLVNKKVTLTGWFNSISGGKYIYLVATDFVEAQGGDQPVEKVVAIKTVADYLQFTEEFAKYTATDVVTLEADLDLTAADFKPENVFAGVLDGKNHTLKISKSIAEKTTDLKFGAVAQLSGTIKNLNVELAATSGDADNTYANAFIGAIAGQMNEGSVIENCSGKVDIDVRCGSTAGRLGGIVGNALGGTVKNCTASGMIVSRAASSTADQIGGVAGHAEGTFNVDGFTSTMNSKYTGVSTPRTGGVVGYAANVVSVSIKNCQIAGKHEHVPATSKKQYTYMAGAVGYTGATFKNADSAVTIDNVTCSSTIYAYVKDAAAEFQFRAGGMIAQAPTTSATAPVSLYIIKNSKFNGEIQVVVEGTSAKTNTIQLGGLVAMGEPFADTTTPKLGATVLLDNCTMAGKIEVKGYAATIGGLFGCFGAPACKMENCKVEAETILSADTASTIGTVAGAPGTNGVAGGLWTNKITTVVGACSLVNAGPAVTMTADNYLGYALGNPDLIADKTGITFEGGSAPSGGGQSATIEDFTIEDQTNYFK